MRRAPTGEWLQRLQAAGVSSCPLQFREQLLDDVQARANGNFVELEHQLVGSHTEVAPPVRFSESPLRAEVASPPLGRDTLDIPLDAGLAAADVIRLRGMNAINIGE